MARDVKALVMAQLRTERRLANYVIITFMLSIWALMVTVKLAPYDINYFLFFIALLISAAGVLVTSILFAAKRQYAPSGFVAALFFISSSPLSLICFIWIYVELVGQYFKF